MGNWRREAKQSAQHVLQDRLRPSALREHLWPEVPSTMQSKRSGTIRDLRRTA